MGFRSWANITGPTLPINISQTLGATIRKIFVYGYGMSSAVVQFGGLPHFPHKNTQTAKARTWRSGSPNVY
jgi:hypothetical protein